MAWSLYLFNMHSASRFSRSVDQVASRIVDLAGRPVSVFVVFLLVLTWGVTGFFVDFSARWELFMGTTSSAVTILMVFLILKAQNKDAISIQLKLNELVASNEQASNRLVDIEGMTEDELKVIRKYYSQLSEFASKRETLQESLSIDESHKDHEIKKEMENELKNIKNR